MPLDPKKLLETTKDSQVEWYKNEIPITREEKRRYKCANPEGPIDNAGCPSNNKYCNCPSQELQPKDAFIIDAKESDPSLFQQVFDFYMDNIFFFGLFGDEDDDRDYAVINSAGELLEKFDTYQEAEEYVAGLDPIPEPTDDELEELLQNSKYCTLIEDSLGEEYLGCDWNDPDSPISCNCPKIGPKFKEWKRYSQTYSTFWNTPKNVPLLRNAQMTLLTAQKAEAIVQGDFSIRPGAIVNIEVSQSDAKGNTDFKSSSGKWLVAEISHHILGANAHSMTLTLIRDSLYKNPNESESPKV
jgi:hypothetical protein